MKNESALYPTQKDRIGIIGGGIWALAIAHLISVKGRSEARIYTRNTEIINSISKSNEYSYNDHTYHLNTKITATSSFEEIWGKEVLFITTPSQHLRKYITSIGEYINPKSIIIICSKGLEEDTSLLMTQVLLETLPKIKNIAILSGPNFAKEILSSLSSISTLGCNDDIKSIITDLLESEIIKLEHSYDINGIQICGAMKNILAIGAGIINGMCLGNNATAAFITKGLHEIRAVIRIYGGLEETSVLSCGIGDLVLSCYSANSRNMGLGCKLGTTPSNKEREDMLASSNDTVEGYRAAKALYNVILRNQMNLPLCTAIYKILYENAEPNLIHQAINSLK